MPDPLLEISQLLEYLPVAAFTCDRGGRIVSFNARAATLWELVDSSCLEPASSRFVGPVTVRDAVGQVIAADQTPIARAIVQASEYCGSMSLRTKSGRDHLLLTQVRQVKDNHDEVVGLCVLLIDHALQPQAEEEFARHMKFCESVIKTASDGICVCVPIDSPPYIRFTVWNDQMVDITGYTVEELNQLPSHDALFPDQAVAQKAVQRMRAISAGDDAQHENWTIVCKQGYQRDVSVSTSMIEISNGSTAIVALIQDMTEKHAVQQALKESDEQLQLAIETTRIRRWVWDLRSQEVAFNRDWRSYAGDLSRHRKISCDEFEQLIHPDDLPGVRERIRKYFAGETPEFVVDFRFKTEQGGFRWLHTCGVLQHDGAGKPIRLFGWHWDVSERKQAEETLRYILQSVAATTGEEYFTQLVHYLCDVCNVDYAMVSELVAGDSQHANTIAVSYRGITLDNFTYRLAGTPCETLWEQRSLCCIAENAKDLYPSDAFLQLNEIHSYLGIPLWEKSGAPIGMLILLSQQPITELELSKSILQVVGARSGAELERRRTELALRESERRLQSIATMLPQSLYLFNLESQEPEYQNQLVARELGYSDEELSAMGPRVLEKLLHPDDMQRIPELLGRWETVQDGEILETEYRLLTKSGQWRNFLGRDTVFERDAQGRPRLLIGTTQDITHRLEAEAEKLRLEAQVLHGQKLESLGVLAGGIAHDFNNLLASMLTYADLAIASLPNDSAAVQYIKNVINGAENAAELSRQMLAYSGKGSFELSAIDLSKLVTETSRLLQASISKRCCLELELASSVPHCKGDTSQLRQVVMNLVINASEALHERSGTIRVSVNARRIEATNQELDFTGMRIDTGDYVVLRVADDGCGMDSKTASKLFDPFFSTKFSGRGLGMSTVLGIIRGHGGAIQVASAPNLGSTFTVLLPVSQEAVQAVQQPNFSLPAWRGKGRILLAEDEASVRNSISILLKTLGFEVIVTCNGKEAVDVFAEQSDSIDIALMDLTMPVMDGSQACHRLREIRCDLPIILMSGYNEEYSRDQSADGVPHAFLHKPFRIDELKQILQKLCR